ncbi:MAG: SRPBCC domain-containing protein [Henriciella sp.]|nr:SRPBCC domain-containing protein [Henriciella sp.]
MTEPVMIKTIYLKAAPEKVWRFITSKEKIALWFHEVDRDLTSKTPFQYLSFHDDKEDRKLMWGEVLEVDPPHKLVHTFTHQWLEGAITTVTWELVAVEDGTQLTMTHSGMMALGALADHDKGWDEHLLRLRMMLS